MAKQYNVNIVGNLTNDNGVLSGFSVNDYATLPETLENLTINSLEIVFKFKTNSLSSNNAIFWTDKLTDDPSIPWAGLRLCNYNVDNYVFDLEVTNNNTQIADIYNTTAILPNKYYYIKALYNDIDGYSLYKSEDGENYTLIGTTAATTMPPNRQAIIGRAADIDAYPMPLDGAIDLNESYIKVNGATWWRGAESITKIQLRHDTAANWTSVNPVLLEGEVGIETDTRKQKFGDGTTAWNSLPYDKGSTALQSNTTVIDGQWVSQQTTIFEGLVSPTQPITYTLPNDYFPDNTAKYEVMFTAILNSGSSTGNRAVLNIATDLYTTAARILETKCISNTVNSVATLVSLPVGTARTITVSGIASNTGICNLYAQAYRRIGSNS